MLLNTHTHIPMKREATDMFKGLCCVLKTIEVTRDFWPASTAVSRVSSGNVLLTLIFPDALPWYVGFLTSSMAGKGEQGDESLTYSDGIHDATIPANR